MDGPTARMLFEALREDIRSLKRDVTAVIVRHDEEIEELQKAHWKQVGALAVIVILFEIGVTLIEHALK